MEDQNQEKRQTRKELNADKIKLFIVPCSIQQANQFVEYLHRHHRPVQVHKYCLAAIDSDGNVHGVAIVSNPLARALDDGLSLEVVRCCCNGTPNCPSILYGACWRAAKEMGFRSMYTYTLGEKHGETGGSLKAIGWVYTEDAGGSPWKHAKRPGSNKPEDPMHLEKKIRWEIHCESYFPIEEVVWPVFVDEDEKPTQLLLDMGGPLVVGSGRTSKERVQKRQAIRNKHVKL